MKHKAMSTAVQTMSYTFPTPLSADVLAIVAELLEPHSIASLSLVSRSFNAISRPALWRNLRIPNETALSRLVASNHPSLGGGTGPSPWLALVRSLEIHHSVWGARNIDQTSLTTLINVVMVNIKHISLVAPPLGADRHTETFHTTISNQSRVVELLFGSGSVYPKLTHLDIEALWLRSRRTAAWPISTAEQRYSSQTRIPWNATTPKLRHVALGLLPSLEYTLPVLEQCSSTVESISFSVGTMWGARTDAVLSGLPQLSKLRHLSWTFSSQSGNYDHSFDHDGLTHLLSSLVLVDTLTTLEVRSSASMHNLLAAISHLTSLTHLYLGPGPMASADTNDVFYDSDDWKRLLERPLPRLTHLHLVRISTSRNIPFFHEYMENEYTNHSPNTSQEGKPSNDGLVKFLCEAAPKLVELTLDGCMAMTPEIASHDGDRRRHASPNVFNALLSKLSPSIKRLVFTHPAVQVMHDPIAQRQSQSAGHNSFARAGVGFAEIAKRRTLDMPPCSNIALLSLIAPSLRELDIPATRVAMGDLAVLMAMSPALKRIVVGGTGSDEALNSRGKMEWRKEGGRWTVVDQDEALRVEYES